MPFEYYGGEVRRSALAASRFSQGFVKARTAQANQIRGLLGEYGLIVPQKIAYIAQRVPALIEDASNLSSRLVPASHLLTSALSST